MGDHAGSVIEGLSAAAGAAVVGLSLRADLVESDLKAAHLLVDELVVVVGLLVTALLFQGDLECFAHFAGAIDFTPDAA